VTSKKENPEQTDPAAAGLNKINSYRAPARAVSIFAVTALILLVLYFALLWAEGQGMDIKLSGDQIMLLKRLFLIVATGGVFLALLMNIFQRRLPPELMRALESLTATQQPRKELEDKYRFFFEESQTLNLIIEKGGGIRETNRSFANLVDAERESVLGSNVLDYVDEGDREKFAGYIGRHLEGELTSRLEVNFIGKRGKRAVRFGEGHLNIVENHVPVGVLISGVDVTSLKDSERSQAELEKKLRQASRMESLGLLAGGVAHDLKNILNPLIGYPDFLLKQLPPDSPLRRPILKMKQSATRTSEMVQNFLALARRGRFEAGKVELNLMIESFLETIEFKELQIRYPDVKITLDLAHRLLPIEGSAAQLRQAFMNLVRNAFEAMPEGGKLTISTFPISLEYPRRGYQQIPRGNFNVITISDEGKGMTEEEMTAIFEPFQSGKTMDGSGSGLGMFVVTGVLEDHRAYLDLQSEKNRGSDFSIYFPLKDSET